MLVESIRHISEHAEPAFAEIADIEAACGFPSPAQDYKTSEIDLNEHLMPNRVATFILRVRGDSMTRAGIYDGDEVVVDRSIQATDGHVVVAVVDGEMTVKRLRLAPNGHAVLAAENRNYPDIEIAELSELHIWGVVTRSLHRVARA